LGCTPRRQAFWGAAGDIGKERPGRLRGGRGAAAPGRHVLVGEDVLTEGTAWLLDRVQPRERAADGRMAGREPTGLESRDRGAGAVEVIHAPAAEPGAVRLLLGEQPIEAGGTRGPVPGLVPEHLER